jgi:hypothetical protein
LEIELVARILARCVYKYVTYQLKMIYVWSIMAFRTHSTS